MKTLLLLNDQLYEADLTPVLNVDYKIELDREENRLELFANGQKVDYGVTWYHHSGKIDPKTGKIHAIFSKNARFRAVFGSNHLDYVPN